VAGHLPDDRVRHALDEEHGGGEVPQIVDAEVSDFGERTDPPKPLAQVSGVRFGKFFYVPESDVRLSREEIFMPPIARKLTEGVDDQSGKWS
jgi:hypothetical protein